MNDALLRQALISLVKAVRDHQVQIQILLQGESIQADFEEIRREHSRDADLAAAERKASERVESYRRKLDELVESGDATSQRLDEPLRQLEA